MIAVEEVSARRAPLTLARLSLSWGPGVHSIVGTRADGGPLRSLNRDDLEILLA